ncbi:hypothetical protein G6O69_16360 [Pseudenhygromyxa sp. WMMC2535]|uniref:hypothetical protein n=1 Tax=Pseudenhygromyxa sp. WMMC2535 TaxID=2712867 RepID=UPI001552919B|nr:hypothetical protein [Pseudenhygromyxa sp. WMMC2535]NVB39416.1 hypothetical protein [Pseudenhygromyxa sp. WMMC2535]
MSPLYQQVLLFPDRAENLGRFSAYKVRFEHWHPLSDPFKACFREVYERGSAAILLIHGEQGAGKTLFARRLQADFDRCFNAEHGTPSDNLWHALVGEPGNPGVVQTATNSTTVQTINAQNGWLDALVERYERPEHRARVFIADDVHKAGFLRSWAGLNQEAFLRTGKEAALPAIAERMVELCRNQLRQSLFVFFSVDAELMLGLHEAIEKTHRGLSRTIELPLPEAEIKEEIVRQNTNSLNSHSYWYCLDGARPEGREYLYEVLHDKRGFTDTFRAVDDALRTTVSNRPGRPANQNLLTLCTLASSTSDAKDFIAARELPLEEEYFGEHIAVWSTARSSWASALVTGADAKLARQAALVESEFAFRWVAFGPRATRSLKKGLVPSLDDKLLEIVKFAPSVGKPKETQKMAELIEAVDEELGELDVAALGVNAFMDELERLGQRRSVVYEPMIAEHFSSYSRGFSAYPKLRPDLILAEYEPCAIASTAGTSDAITRAISRKSRSVEFTSFMGDGLGGLEGYLRHKISKYAEMLESV